jgi:mono/diheme cytochrome c family protein
MRPVAAVAALVLALLTGAGCHSAPPGAMHASAGGGLPGVLDVDSLDAHDRCPSCHRNVLEVDAKLAAQPHTAHPGRLLDAHPPLRFGCTICHGGNGQATTARAAHAAGPGNREFLSGAATEIACGACHRDETALEGAPHLSHGRELIRRAQCDGCHQIAESPRAGSPGPDLSGIASRTNPRWLFRWIKNPRDYASNARMPRYELDDRSIDALVGYLMTFRASAGFDTTGYPRGDATRGGNLVRLSFCISCHAINDKGGTGTIDLGRVGNKLTRARLLSVIAATHEVDPRTAMPQYHFDRGEAADVAAYLGEQLSDPSFDSNDADSALVKLGSYWPSESGRVDTGRRLFKELRCGNCHAFPGGEGWIRVGPNLSRLGDKKLSEIAWGPAKFPHTLADYVWHKVERPRAYESGPHQLKMPGYDFTPEEARDVTIALFGWTDAQVLPEAFVIRGHADDSLAVGGEFGELVERYRCLSCHSVRGVGHNLTYDLGIEGSRARKEWLAEYLKQPYTLRPILTVRMPIFHLTDHEAQVLAEGIATSWRDARIDSAGSFAVGPREVEAGRALFEGRGCMGCHQVGSRGGYVGPGFTAGTSVGRKLQPGWIVAWLENPRAIKPDAIEPHYGFSREQARALTAYLMTLSAAPQAGSR